MSQRTRSSSLERWEIAIIKAMINSRKWKNNQDILAFFTRPTRSVNHRAISEIRDQRKHSSIKAASTEDLDAFLLGWPEVDPETGLSIRGDELLIKAREAMIAAVHNFNGAGLTFRAELFIVTAMIAWTYLLHAYFKRKNVDYRYHERGALVRTPSGAEKYWDLATCLSYAQSPLVEAEKMNLLFLLELRHEIEHRTTNRIDDSIGAKLQACCLNFNDALQRLFGMQYGLQRRLPLALQFVSLAPDQAIAIKSKRYLPRNIATMMETFDSKLPDPIWNDPRFAFRVFMIPKTANREGGADLAVQLVDRDSEIAEKFSIALKEVEKKKYLPKEIVATMQGEGFRRFNITRHTELWKELNAKDPKKPYGAIAVGSQWCWYETWLQRVRQECQDHPEKYS
ncbi:DUF3644 domain-containing protein [Aestuariivirga sp.]|uniref:DUF3644 domain-containing protein n=1 Tax=Aestuariivirga sp. TaxID=2650926 RepID=UPI0035B25914